jgi:hypothetical protein
MFLIFYYIYVYYLYCEKVLNDLRNIIGLLRALGFHPTNKIAENDLTEKCLKGL